VRSEKNAMIDNNCPFCTLQKDRIVSENESTLTVRDAFPVSDGHTLVIPKRHVESLFDCNPDEKADILQALEEAKVALDKEFSPDGYNIGINDGEAGGQTIPHLHIHLIPRYRGDVSDPRGGVRWIFPDKAKYWSE